jgi:hypothetical protein
MLVYISSSSSFFSQERNESNKAVVDISSIVHGNIENGFGEQLKHDNGWEGDCKVDTYCAELGALGSS